MNKWGLVLIVVALGALAYVLLGGDDDDGGFGLEGEDEYADEGTGGAELRGDPRAGARTGDGRGPRPEDDGKEKPKVETFLTGFVLDAETGRPIEGALVETEVQKEPCPRLPSNFYLPGTRVEGDPRMPPGPKQGGGGSNLRDTTDADGRFELQRVPAEWSVALVDVFASAKGYVAGMACAMRKGADPTIRLQRAKQFKGQVTDLHGRPVEKTIVRCKPLQGMPVVPGTVAAASTDREGLFVLDGLLAQEIVVTADHPEFMPASVGPLLPGLRDEQIRMTPAYRVSFELRTEDGEPVVNPTLQWATTGDPPQKGVLLLAMTPTGPPARPDSEGTTSPVRIPCRHPAVNLEIKSDGYAAWRSNAEPLPLVGGERLFPVTLVRDTSMGSVVLHFQDPDGNAIEYSALNAVPGITWLGTTPMDQAFVLEGGTDLTLPSLPAGPYAIGVRCAAYAPGEAKVTVVAGQATEATIALQPPAKLRVRFTSAERRLVRFRLMQNGLTVAAFPETDEAEPAQPGGAPSLVAQEGEGLVLSGLAPGRYTIEVTSPELVSVSQSVQVTADEIAEVEIEVQAR